MGLALYKQCTGTQQLHAVLPIAGLKTHWDVATPMKHGKDSRLMGTHTHTYLYQRDPAGQASAP
jgi:hypothetical protein